MCSYTGIWVAEFGWDDYSSRCPFLSLSLLSGCLVPWVLFPLWFSGWNSLWLSRAGAELLMARMASLSRGSSAGDGSWDTVMGRGGAIVSRLGGHLMGIVLRQADYL